MMLSILLLLMFFGFSQGEDVPDYSECSTKRSVLLKALFETEDNIYELNRIFVPARLPTSTYVNVTYTFLDSNSQTGDCSVTYIWAVGGFLLIQPPQLFDFISLYFNRPPNEPNELTLTLPSECRALVMNGTNNCTCTRKYNRPNDLDGLTQQLNQITKYSDPNQVVQDLTSDAQAVCKEELKDKFFNRKETDVYLVFTVAIPIIVMVVIVTIIRSIYPLLHSKLTKSSDEHPNLAGFTISGIYVLLYILAMDCAAVYYYSIDAHEYSGSNASGEFNLFILPITLAFDLAVTLLLLAFILYLWCIELPCSAPDNSFVRWLYISCCILPYFYCIFGSKSQASIWRAGQRVKLLAKAKLTSDHDIKLTTRGKAKEKNGDEVELKADQQVTVSADQKISATDCQFNLNYGQLVEKENGDKVILKADGKALLQHTNQAVAVNENEKVTLLNPTQEIVLEAEEEVTLNVKQIITLKSGEEVELIDRDVNAKLITSTRIALTDGDEVEVVNQNTNNGTNPYFTNQRNIWIVTGLMFAPLFSIASHSGYILAAALTEPAKTTAAFLIALGSILYMFSMFRQCYIVHKDDSGLFAACNCECGCCKILNKDNRKCLKSWCAFKTHWIFLLPLFPLWAIASHLSNICCLCWQLCSTLPDPGYFKIAEPDNKDPKFSMRGFFLSCSWGILIVGVLAFVLSAFFLLPLPTFPLAEYLETIIQVVIVVLAFIITYKVFTAEDVDKKIKQYFKEFRLKNINHFEDNGGVGV